MRKNLRGSSSHSSEASVRESRYSPLRVWTRLYWLAPWIAAFGGMCYTVYLYHSLVLAVTVRATKSLTYSSSYILTYGLQLAIGLVAITAVSVVLFLLFEKPFMERDWPQRWRERWKQWRSAPQPQPACAD